MKTDETYREEELKVQAGKTWREDELNLCLNYGADKIQVHLLNQVMKSKILSEPSLYLGNCYGTLMIVAGRYESKFGAKVGFQKGKEIGTLIGGAVTSIRYLYKQYDDIGTVSLLRKTEKGALEIFNTYTRMPIKDRSNYFKSTKVYCAVFGIEVDRNNLR